jgi:hypothetical protein
MSEAYLGLLTVYVCENKLELVLRTSATNKKQDFNTEKLEEIVLGILFFPICKKSRKDFWEPKN